MSQIVTLTLANGALKIEGTTKEILDIVEDLQKKGVAIHAMKASKK